MRPESKRGVALSELACAGYGKMPVRTVPLEQDSVSHFFPRGRVWVVKTGRSMVSVGV